MVANKNIGTTMGRILHLAQNSTLLSGRTTEVEVVSLDAEPYRIVVKLINSVNEVKLHRIAGVETMQSGVQYVLALGDSIKVPDETVSMMPTRINKHPDHVHTVRFSCKSEDDRHLFTVIK